MNNELHRYSLAHRLLHWAMAIAILLAIPVGFLMDDAPEGALKNGLYDVHKSLGVLVLILALARLVVKRNAAPLAPIPDQPDWQRQAAASTHHALYVLMIAVPLLGFVANSFYGAAIPFFWLFTIPTFTPHNEDIAGVIFSLHTALAFLFAALIALHIAAALYHRLVKKDSVFSRMGF